MVLIDVNDNINKKTRYITLKFESLEKFKTKYMYLIVFYHLIPKCTDFYYCQMKITKQTNKILSQITGINCLLDVHII